MYYTPLTRTSTEILMHLTSHIRKTYTIREIAKTIQKDYKITHTSIRKLEKQNLITVEERRPITLCRLNLRENTTVIAQIEAARTQRHIEKHPNTETIKRNIHRNMTTPFYTMLLFGSHARETATEQSDIDLLIITSDEADKEEASVAVGSTQHTTPTPIHEVILTAGEFTTLLKQRTTNIAWETADNHIVLYGSETFLNMLEGEIT